MPSIYLLMFATLRLLLYRAQKNKYDAQGIEMKRQAVQLSCSRNTGLVSVELCLI